MTVNNVEGRLNNLIKSCAELISGTTEILNNGDVDYSNFIEKIGNLEIEIIKIKNFYHVEEEVEQSVSNSILKMIKEMEAAMQ